MAFRRAHHILFRLPREQDTPSLSAAVATVTAGAGILCWCSTNEASSTISVTQCEGTVATVPAAVVEATKHPIPVTTLYLVRHAESTWNAAFSRKNPDWPEWLTYLLDPVPILTDKDHPITSEGARQCASLRQRIIAASMANDLDAQAILGSNTLIASSPLTRSVVTAALTLAPLEQEEEKAILLLPAARESDAHWFYGRDSLGTKASDIAARVESVLLKHGSGNATLDMSVMGNKEVWWSEGDEDDSAMTGRLQQLLQDIVAAAQKKNKKTIILTTHSLIIRRLFRAMLDAPSINHAAKSDTSVGELLGKQSIMNCGCVAVDIIPSADGRSLRITRPRMLFDTEFASFSPII